MLTTPEIARDCNATPSANRTLSVESRESGLFSKSMYCAGKHGRDADKGDA